MAERKPTPKDAPKKKGIIQEFVGFAATAIIIMIVLVVFVFPMFYGSSKERKLAAEELDAIGKALTEFRSENGKWPGTTNSTVSSTLSENPGKAKPWSSHERRDGQGRFLDPWNNPFQFFLSNDGFIVRSSGPDGKFSLGTVEQIDDDLYLIGQ
ncbi:MAG: type II secretion system protein GspG [Verrucomicrobiota bacterium]